MALESVGKQDTAVDVESRVRAHANATGHSIKELFEAAGVSYSGWWRWRNTDLRPTLRNLEKLLAVPPKHQNGTLSGVRLGGGE